MATSNGEMLQYPSMYVTRNPEGSKTKAKETLVFRTVTYRPHPIEIDQASSQMHEYIRREREDTVKSSSSEAEMRTNDKVGLIAMHQRQQSQTKKRKSKTKRLRSPKRPIQYNLREAVLLRNFWMRVHN